VRRIALSLLVGLAVLLPSLSAADDAHQAVEKELRKHFLKQVVTLRHFYTTSRLRFDAEGNLLDSAAEGPWTLYGLIQVSAVKLKEHQVVLEGTRLYVVFNDKQERVYYRSRDRVHVEVEYELGDNLLLAAHSALNKVLLTLADSLADLVPDYWKPFLKGNRAATSFDSIQSVANAAEVLAQEGEKPVKATTGMQEAKLLERTAPVYPELAKMARIEGTVTVEALISKDGTIKRVRVLQARGMGLEEAVVKAVKQWRYETTVLNGEPVEVITIINVVFKLQ
jgi:TonB family protein